VNSDAIYNLQNLTTMVYFQLQNLKKINHILLKISHLGLKTLEKKSWSTTRKYDPCDNTSRNAQALNEIILEEKKAYKNKWWHNKIQCRLF
jgi:hypothetical protein